MSDQYNAHVQTWQHAVWITAQVRFLTTPGYNAHVWAWFAYEAHEDECDDECDDEDDYDPEDDPAYVEHDPGYVHLCRYVVHVYVKGVPKTQLFIFGTNDREQALQMKESSELFGHYVEVDDQSNNPYGG